MIKNRVIKPHIKWAKKETSGMVLVMVCMIFGVVAVLAGWLPGLYVGHETTIIQEESEPTRTCYFMRIKFVGSDQNGAELEVTEIPAECPETSKPRRD